MYKLLIPFFFILKVYPGVGGISGGHINFQRNSTFVNVLYSKSLCHDNYEFRTMAKNCKKWKFDSDSRKCERWVMEEITQPIESTRERCRGRRSDDKACTEWETIIFVQSPKRIVKILDDSNQVIETKKITVPLCH